MREIERERLRGRGIDREREKERIGYMVINISSVMKIFSNDTDDIELCNKEAPSMNSW